MLPFLRLCEGLTVVMLVVGGVGCAKVVVVISCLVCRVGFVRWWNVG